MKFALAPNERGRAIIASNWIATAVLAVVTIPAAFGVAVFERATAWVGLGSFAIGFVVWVVSFALVIARSARGDEVAVASWVFLQDSAPRPVRTQLLGAVLLTLVVTVVTMTSSPFAVLANLLPLGLASLWGARHGTFPPRPAMTGARDGRRSQ